jgi:hypothetical protein
MKVYVNAFSVTIRPCPVATESVCLESAQSLPQSPGACDRNIATETFLCSVKLPVTFFLETDP